MPERRRRKPRLAVWKFTGCDGCQLTLLDCEDELLALAEMAEIAYFLEASRSVVRGPYDLSLIEGSVSTPEEATLIQQIRRESKVLVAMGACATAGGIQALRNFAHIDDYLRQVYATPEYVRVLETSLPASAYVDVDFELRGCPPNKAQMIELLTASLQGRRPNIPGHSLCIECKRQGILCVIVKDGTPCLGPVTQAGCGALCPANRRGCYGCFGPKESPNTASLRAWLDRSGVPAANQMRLFRSFNCEAPAFKEASERYGPSEASDTHD